MNKSMRAILFFIIIFGLTGNVQAADTSSPAALNMYNEAMMSFTGAQNSDRAIGLLEQLVKKFPDDPLAPGALFQIGWTRFEEKKYDDARIYFRKLSDQYPLSPSADDAVYQIAYVDYLQKKYPEARQGFQDVLTRFLSAKDSLQRDKLPFAQFMIAETWQQEGNRAEAIRAYSKVIENFGTGNDQFGISQAKRAAKRILKLLEGK